MSAVPPDTYPTHPQAIVLSILAFFACTLSIPLLILHVRSRNFALGVLMLSFTLLNLQNRINPLIWRNDDTGSWWSGPVLCGVEAKLQVGLSVAIPGAATCLCRQLALILNTSSSSSTTSGNHHSRPTLKLIIEITLCLVLPLSIAALHILVQPYRYFLTPIAGCQFALDSSGLAALLVLLPPALISLLGTIYCAVVILRLCRHRRRVTTILVRSRTELFLRVALVAALFVLVCLPLDLWAFWQSWRAAGIGEPGAVWLPKWSDVHPPWWTRLIFKMDAVVPGVLRDRWLQVGAGYIIVAVFGTASDARAMCARWGEAWLRSCRCRCYYRRRSGRLNRAGERLESLMEMRPVREVDAVPGSVVVVNEQESKNSTDV